MSLSDRLDRLGARSRPHYGMLVLWTLLACAAALCAYFELHWPAARPRGVRTGPATVLSFLPDALLLDRWAAVVSGVLFAAGAGLWAAGRAVPWSGWLAALSFTAVVALYAENSSQLTHVAHLTNTLLLVYAAWWHANRGEIRAARAAGHFWATPLYPRWAYSLSVFSVGLFYGLSGLTKWRTSGSAWPNGVSLQLWATLWGDPNSVWTRLVLSQRHFAAALQWAALLGETAGFLAIVSTRLRPLVGLALIGFHVGQIAVFGWGFHANMVLLALVFLPFYEWVPRAVLWWEKRRDVATAAPVRPEVPQGAGR
jgi:hypothetical protein